MTVIRSLIFNAFFFGWTAVLFIVCLPLLAAPRHVLLRAGDLWIGGILGALRVVCGLSYEVRGLENLPDGPAIVASKHQSAFDTVVFTRFLPDAAYVLKKELLAVPCFGWYLRRCRMIPVDRSGGSRALKEMIAVARQAAAEGRAILIFPEGTRTRPGDSRPYHPGVAALYKALHLPTVPVALNSGLYWPRRSFIKRPGRIVVELLPAIPPGLERQDFMARLREAIEDTSMRLNDDPSENID